MASTIKVNNIQNQCGANIINESANTITIGASGDTITLACGASQTGFGRTGTVDWDTTAKTASFTAVSGNGYFVNTTSGAITVTLPATPSAGDIVAVKDYAGTFGTNNLTIGRNGEPINGGNAIDVVISTNGASIFLVYVDGTQGWVATQDDSSTFAGTTFITATGGTITTCGNDKIHTFTGPGTFTVCSASSNSDLNILSYMVVAGGGGTGSRWHSGGGGAGGFRELKSPNTSYTASPLNGYSTPGNRITATATSYPITVGGGGAGGSPDTCNSPAPNNGSNSVFSTITSTGGGKGGTYNEAGAAGGSGGASGANSTSPSLFGGAGNTPPVSPPQGNTGGNGEGGSGNGAGGGGGGATQAGSPTPSEYVAGDGGDGATTSISGSPTAYAGGGAGGRGNAGTTGTGGVGGGGNTGSNGTNNTGGGGGGPNNPCAVGTTGGSGIVIIRYKYQ